CLAEDEEDARRLALARGGHPAYAGAKLALGRWVRWSAPGAEWTGAGVRLNAVAPGAVLTPLLQDGLEHPVFGPAISSLPIPTGAFGAPEQIAGAIAFLLGPDAAVCCWRASGSWRSSVPARRWPARSPRSSCGRRQRGCSRRARSSRRRSSRPRRCPRRTAEPRRAFSGR